MFTTPYKSLTKLFSIFILIIGVFVLFSCKKFIEVVPPNTSINGINVFTDDVTASAVITGIYTSMSNESFQNGVTSMSLLPSLSADELTLFDKNNVVYKAYYSNSLTRTITTNPWNFLYAYIFKTNDAIAGLTKNSDKLTPSIQQQLLGEAKFIRAFCYFYLVNLYGDVPMPLETDPNNNRLLVRIDKQYVYQQMIIDLKDAQRLLSDNYLGGRLTEVSSERARPSRWVATALLARIYLYNKDWSSAEGESSKIINNSNFELSDISNAFLKASLGNKEAIWQLQPTGTTVNSNTKEGRLFILPATGPAANYPVYLSDTLVNSFESGDLRKATWVSKVTPVSSGTITYYFPYKYKIGSVNTNSKEYSMVLRLAEQYLIRAEARAQQNKLSEAIDDLDMIRGRASLSLIANTNPGISQTALLDKILHERQVELFTEWGHRWFDLKRTGKIDAVMSGITSIKGGSWSLNWALYPIPQEDLTRDHNLEQNLGY